MTNPEREAFKAYNPLGYVQMDGLAVWQAACAWQRAQPVQADAKTAKQRYDAAMKPGEEPSAIERLRFFCSLAMGGQDWIDAEPFFAAVAAQQVQADAGAVAGHFVKRSMFGPWIEVDPVKESGTPLYAHPSPAGESDKMPSSEDEWKRFQHWFTHSASPEARRNDAWEGWQARSAMSREQSQEKGGE